jgi:hypothetical protein
LLYDKQKILSDKQRSAYSVVPLEPQKMEEEYRKDHFSSQQAAPKIVSRSTQNNHPRTRSPGVGARSDSPGFGIRTDSPLLSAHHSLKSR